MEKKAPIRPYLSIMTANKISCLHKPTFDIWLLYLLHCWLEHPRLNRTHFTFWQRTVYVIWLVYLLNVCSPRTWLKVGLGYHLTGFSYQCQYNIWVLLPLWKPYFTLRNINTFFDNITEEAENLSNVKCCFNIRSCTRILPKLNRIWNWNCI